MAVSVPQRALIVANPTAGTTSTGLVDEVVELCTTRLPHVRVRHTTGPGDAVEAVRRARSGTDLVVAVGGDGTVREVVEGLTADGDRATATLFAVPAGTGNSGYRMLWGDRPWQEALRSVLDDPAEPDRAILRRLDLAHLVETGAKVFLGACSGVIAEALLTARAIPLVGRERYARAFGDTAAAFTPYPGRVTVDGELLHEGGTVLANVGGGRFRGGQYLVLPHSELDDGLLDVCVIGAEIPASQVPELTRRAEHFGMPGVVYGRGRHIVVERLDGLPLCFEHDGELQPAATTRMTLSVLPGALPAWGAATLRGALVRHGSE